MMADMPDEIWVRKTGNYWTSGRLAPDSPYVFEQYIRADLHEEQVTALQTKVHLCAGYDKLERENARLRRIMEEQTAAVQQALDWYEAGRRMIDDVVAGRRTRRT